MGGGGLGLTTQANYNKLQNDYDALQAKYTKLQVEYNDVKTRLTVFEDAQTKLIKQRADDRFSEGWDMPPPTSSKLQ